MRTNRTQRKTVLQGFGASFAAVVVSLFAQAALAQEALCRVEAIFGKAEIVTSTERRALSLDMRVAVQDRIETGDESRVTLLCPDDLRITIGPASEVVLTEVEEASTGWAAILPRGIARFARPLFGGARFEVRTPSAVASVRSTVWVVDVADGATAVFVEEGGVDVFAGSAQVLLEPGDGVDVTAEGALGPVRAWGQGRIDSLADRLAFPAQ